jgi:hypothetical protein
MGLSARPPVDIDIPIFQPPLQAWMVKRGGGEGEGDGCAL